MWQICNSKSAIFKASGKGKIEEPSFLWGNSQNPQNTCIFILLVRTHNSIYENILLELELWNSPVSRLCVKVTLKVRKLQQIGLIMWQIRSFVPKVSKIIFFNIKVITK